MKKTILAAGIQEHREKLRDILARLDAASGVAGMGALILVDRVNAGQYDAPKEPQKETNATYD